MLHILSYGSGAFFEEGYHWYYWSFCEHMSERSQRNEVLRKPPESIFSRCYEDRTKSRNSPSIISNGHHCSNHLHTVSCGRFIPIRMMERTFPVGVEVIWNSLLGSAQKQRESAIHHVLALALYVTG
jgi:hypothetical protein